jgi:hypothetical protein
MKFGIGNRHVCVRAVVRENKCYNQRQQDVLCKVVNISYMKITRFLSDKCRARK